ncbi:MAG: EscU/YscU/HrcU family type III secretion system export apparatus switch protein [Actinobacteria bacterium]|nr:EscU/YscU/HrcU family type III secretion system export apparatus switch protein [Actinomycetota bacterium]
MARREGKTEAPTLKKKQDARKKGTVSKSPDLGPWITLLVATYVVPSTISNTTKAAIASLSALRGVAAQPDPGRALDILGSSMRAGLMATMPFLLVCMLVGVVTSLGQSGLVLSLHPLKPDFKRVNPMQGVKRLFSMRSVWETGKQMAKGVVIGWLCWPHIQKVSEQLSQHGRVPLWKGLGSSAHALVGMTRTTCYAVIAIALVDFAYQRRTKLLDLRMTKQEVRDEVRNSEGDPHVKGRIRSMQAALSRSRMMSAVPTASVVITNPTHIAIAVRYDPAAGGAPTVVAAGVGSAAATIREKAREVGVPIVEAKPLARALWRSCEVGDEIPVALYEAVAKVLAFVRRLKGSILAASVLPLPRQFHVDEQWLESLPSRRSLKRRKLAPAT